MYKAITTLPVCILVVLTQTWLFLVPFLKVHVLETLECSAGICLRNREYMIMKKYQTQCVAIS